ncbi:hypothetical protein M422DRAFT_255133 [Sphaerobolus stellatus SS14]|uniref:Uncharacterized protein n=1 Tax=Sphaerobolus stellatus (strain SS14) TaxID=990650 RepID=A0A0C9VUB7_SPHS4|nr:hypothetical protein M422DRAFT_255133 [Sphaerobolus stellatus SS14]
MSTMTFFDKESSLFKEYQGLAYEQLRNILRMLRICRCAAVVESQVNQVLFDTRSHDTQESTSTYQFEIAYNNPNPLHRDTQRTPLLRRLKNGCVEIHSANSSNFTSVFQHCAFNEILLRVIKDITLNEVVAPILSVATPVLYTNTSTGSPVYRVLHPNTCLDPTS